MKFLNVGVLEFVFILLLALIVLGPRKAVETAGEVGRWVKDLMRSEIWRDVVSASKEIKDLPKKMMDEAEIQKTIDELDRTTGEINQSIGGARGVNTRTKVEPVKPQPQEIQADQTKNNE